MPRKNYKVKIFNLLRENTAVSTDSLMKETQNYRKYISDLRHAHHIEIGMGKGPDDKNWYFLIGVPK